MQISMVPSTKSARRECLQLQKHILGYEYETEGKKKSWKLESEEINGYSKKVFLENMAVTWLGINFHAFVEVENLLPL